MATKQRCKKGNVFPCKTRCVPRYHWKSGKEQECRNVATGTPKNFLEWAKSQGAKKKAINTQRKAEGKSFVKSDKAGYLVEKDGKDYVAKAEQAREIATKAKNPATKAQALKVAEKFDKLASSALAVRAKSKKPDKIGDLLRNKNFNNAEFEDFDIPAKAFKSTVEAKKAYRELAQKYHPDRGGSEEQMANLNVLFDQINANIEKQRKKRQPKAAKPKVVQTKASKTNSKANPPKDKLQKINEDLGKQADQELDCLFG